MTAIGRGRFEVTASAIAIAPAARRTCDLRDHSGAAQAGGLTSQGMIVAASLEGGSPVLAGSLEDAPVGARLK